MFRLLCKLYTNKAGGDSLNSKFTILLQIFKLHNSEEKTEKLRKQAEARRPGENQAALESESFSS